jgi:glycopeptide antibiotics resistance protein
MEAMHILMHILLFGGLVILVIKTFHLPLNKQTALWMIPLVFTVGLLQEGLQLLEKARPFGWWEVFDLGVDLAGAALGWYILLIFSRRIGRVKEKQYG